MSLTSERVLKWIKKADRICEELPTLLQVSAKRYRDVTTVTRTLANKATLPVVDKSRSSFLLPFFISPHMGSKFKNVQITFLDFCANQDTFLSQS